MANEEYLKQTYLAQSEDPKIKALAGRIAGNKKGRAAASTIFNWVRDNYQYRIGKTVGAKSLLDRQPRWAMSFDKSNMLVALCRAKGIPARYLNLECQMATKTHKELGHSKMHKPAELLINGKWTVADPTFGSDTARLISPSRLGRPTWSRIYKSKTTAGMPRMDAFIGNLIVPRLKQLKELQNVMDQLRRKRPKA